MPRTSPRSDARRASSSTGFRAAARLGYAVDGLLHVLIGGIAIGIAVGAGGQSADQSGALSQLAGTPGGIFVLWVIVIGLLALALWDLVFGTILPQGADRRWTKRVSSGAKAVAYAAVAITAFTFARGASASSTKSATSLSAALLAAPGGVVLLVGLGLTIIAIGGFFVWRGASRRFTQDLRVPSRPLRTATLVLGALGYVAKGIALVVVGILFVVGAVTFDPGQTTGLDGALKALAALPFGTVILVAVGIGLIAYGLYCGLRARLAKL